MKFHSISLAFIALLSSLFLSGSPESAFPDKPEISECLETRCLNSIAVQNVSIVNMLNNTIVPGQTVVILGEEIIEIGKAGSIEIPEQATIVNGTGKFLMPGLAEMHAHIPVPRDGSDENVRETMFLYLAGGVTTIRGMLGAPYHLKLKGLVADGEIVGPSMYTSGPSVNGNSVPTVEIAQRTVTDQKKAGYDFLKLHPGLTREVFDQVVATAQEVGIPYAGHVSTDVGVRHAIASKYASIDHVDGYLEGLVPESAGVNPSSNGFFGFNFTDLAMPETIGDLVKSTKEAGVWVVPTQCLMERWIGPAEPESLASEPEMKYMNPAVLRNWVNTKKRFVATNDYTAETAEKFIDIRRQIIKAMHDEGVGLLLGSDAPQVFNVPGFSIYHELDAMVAAGLSPYEAIKTGTVNPAEFFGKRGETGIIAKGSIADLILVNRNPLVSVKNIRNPAGVIYRGNWLSGDAIAAKLKEIEEKYN